MEIKINGNVIMGIVGAIGGLVGLGYALGTQSKMNQISDRLDRSIDELSKGIDVDIPKDVVDAAVQKAVDVKTAAAVKSATDAATKEVSKDIHRQVNAAIESQYQDLKDVVLAELKKKAANIDEARLKDEIIKEAKKQAEKKLDGSMDDILSKFNSDLDNISKIYRSIASTMTKDQNTPTFRLV